MKKILFILVSLLCFSVFAEAQNKFPINVPLTTNAGMDELSYVSTQSGTYPKFGSNGMTLTSQELGMFSGAYFKDLSFSIDKGFVIEFSYDVYATKMSSLNVLGDGFSLILFDGSVKQPTLGYNGSSLGYVYNRSNLKGGNVPGLTGAFLGIGFDTFGAYNKKSMQTKGDWRNGLSDYGANTVASTYFNNATTDFVTVRGPVNTTADTGYYGTDRAGYPVLISQNIYNKANPTTTTLYYTQLQPSDAWTTYSDAYSVKTENTLLKTPFTIAGNVAGATYPSVNSRRARVEMIPSGTTGVFYLNVSIITTDVTNPKKVINKYKIDTNSTIKYSEILNMGSSQGVTNLEMPMKAPSTLKLGWAASTGEAWANIVIRDAVVTLPYVPIVLDDAVTACKNVGSYSTFNALDKAWGYNIAASDPTPDKSYLDKSSFRFMIPNGSTTSPGYNANSSAYEYATSNATYSYDKSTGIITVKVTNSSIASGTKDVIYYDIMNLNAVSSDYRSKVAAITVTFGDTGCEVIPTIPNPKAVDDVTSLCNTVGVSTSIQPLNNDLGYISGSTTGSSNNLDLASFTFTTSAGVSKNPTQSQSTSYANYVYNSTTGNLTITRNSTTVATGTKDILYYTVKNKNGTVSSNVATITVTFTGCGTTTATAPSVGFVDGGTLCSTAGTTSSIDPYSGKGTTGYALINGSNVASINYIDKSTFRYTDLSGNILTTSNVYTSDYATYTYNSSTGLVNVVLNNTISGQVADGFYFTVQNTDGGDRSKAASVSLVYDSSACKSSQTTLRINAPQKGMFINGMGDLPLN